MFTTTRYILLTAVRDWLFIALFIAIIFAISISSLLGGTAVTEEGQMILSYITSSSRMILLVGLMVFVCFHVRRAFDNREVELILSRPISRPTFVFSYWLGFAVLSCFLVIPVTLAVPVFSSPDFGGLIFWSISLLFEAFIVVAFSLFISLILKSAVSSVLASFGFYFIARIMGFFLMLIHNYLFEVFSASWFMSKLMLVVSTVLPRLDLFGKSKWLIYGPGADDHLWVFVFQAAIYIPFLLLMAISDFKRKQF